MAAEPTAVRVALWRALHLEVDAPPHVLVDDLGLKLAVPAEGWREQPDMDPMLTRPFRASIVARERFIEDFVEQQSRLGVKQYVILGAGLDTFAQRRPEIASTMKIFEVDQPGPQAWKRQRLHDLGQGVPECLKLVSVDFESDHWWSSLLEAGLNVQQPAIIACCGVSMYLTREAIFATLEKVAKLAPGSTLVMSFLLPLELAKEAVKPALQFAEKSARASGTPFISFFTPAQILSLAHEAGFKEAKHVSAANLTERYFSGRTDGLRPPFNAEELLVAMC